MKRGLAFLAVLAAGGLLLWWGDRVSRDRRDRAAESRPEVTREPEPEAPPSPTDPTPPQDEGPDDRFFVRGKAELTVFPEPVGGGVSRRTHRVEGSFHPLDERGSHYEVRELEMQVFGESDVEVETIQAAKARFRLEFGPQLEPEVADGGRVVLEDVAVTRHVGHPLAPLVFEAPELEASLSRDELRSTGDHLVLVTGLGLEASGRGLLYEGQVGRIELRRDGKARLEREGEPAARFAAPTGGPLELRRIGAPEEDRIELRAERGGRLVLPGEPPTGVDADELWVRGVVAEGGFRVEEGRATGRVVASRGVDEYRGESARLFADDAGRITRAVIEREPEARVVIPGDPAPAVVVARGAGPLTAWLEGEGEQRFRLEGPARARVEEEDLSLHAEGLLEGLALEGGAVQVLARERVVVREGDARLDTPSLDALLLPGGGVDLSSPGPSHLTMPDERGAEVTVDVEGEADVRARGGRWTLPLARGVDVRRGGELPFHATAGEAHDLDPAAWTGRLRGDVRVEGPFGEAEAARAVVRGRDDATLHGVPGDPARARLLPQRVDEGAELAADVELATFQALTIDLRPDRLEATGGVRARLDEVDRRWELDAARTELVLREPIERGGPRTFTLDARRVTRAERREDGFTTTLRTGHLQAGGLVHELEDGPPRVELTWAVATGGVELETDGPRAFSAAGERLAFLGGTARLTPAPGERVEIREEHGTFEADALTWDGRDLNAERPRLEVSGGLLVGGAAPQDVAPGTIEADHLRLEPQALVFSGHVLAQGSDPTGLPVRLDAEWLRVVVAEGRDPAELRASDIESFVARGNVQLVYGGLALARAAECELTPTRVVVRGDERRDARIDAGGLSLRSSRVEVDLETFLVESDRGVLTTSPAQGGWTLRYARLEPREVIGETVLALVAPRYEGPGERRARGDFAALWVHADAWAARGRALLGGEPPPADAPTPKASDPRRSVVVGNVFRDLLAGQLGRLVKVVHLLGNLEVTEHGRTTARASEAWLDLERREGWLEQATLVATMDLGGDEHQERLRILAERLVTEADGTLRAEDARLTTSTHEVPGYVIHTGELVLLPREDGLWSFSARPNRIRFAGGLGLPLPPLGSLVLDEAGDFVGFETESGEVWSVENVTAGDTARFGTALGGSVRYPVGDLGRWFSRLFGFDDVRGDWATEGSYLSERGILVGVGLELRERKEREAEDDYWLDLNARGISDSGEDRGLVRVDQDERGDLRTWFHGAGRYPFRRTEWLETKFSTQSDPGVQGEFYQDEFLEYEREETDVHWRRADGSNYYSARAKVRTDSFRTQVEELPAFGLYGGETPLATLFGAVPLLWRRSFDAGYLRRREGDLGFDDPFFGTGGTPDGLGDREVLRADLRNRLSTPLRTGVADVVATPWLEAGLTAWDEGIDPERDPSRAALVGGLDLATTFLERTDAGYLHTLSPTVHVRGDLALEGEDGRPVRFDELEDSPAGDEAGAGLRALWSHPDRPQELDLSLRLLQRRDRGRRASQDRVEVLGAYRTELARMPFGLLTDLRVDPDAGDTIYGRSTVALAPTDAWLFELSHRRARGVDGTGLFETASFDTRWTIDPKWELQLGQSINVKGSGSLRSEFTIRRFGADFLFELEVLDRAGEGGTTVRVNIAPMFLWERRPLGILERGS